MAKLSLDLKNFKKVKSDKNSSTFEHSDGHSITINHDKLTPAQRLDMGNLATGEPEKNRSKVGEKRMMADGGSTDDAIDASQFPTSIDFQGKGDTKATYDNPTPKQDPRSETQIYGNSGKTPKMMADGGSTSDSSPVTINLGDDNAPNSSTEPASDDVTTTPNPSPTVSPPPPAVQNAAQDVQKQAAAAQLQQQAVQATVAANSPTASLPPQAASTIQQSANATPPDDPYGIEATSNALEQGINEQKAGLFGQAAATGIQSQAEQKALNTSISNQQDLATDYKQNVQQLMDEHQNFIQDVQDSHIDPNHYLGTMDTPKKITTAIGLILGGIGGGLTHQENPALRFLNAQIDRDISAQQANLGKKETLLSANMQQFGNIRDATQMTAAQIAGITANQLKAAAAQSASPMAKASALNAAGVIDTNNAQMLGQIAMRRTLTNGANTGKVDPSQFIRMIVPENEKAGALKELGEAQGMVKAKDNIMSAFDQLSQINTIGNRAAHLGFTPAAVSAIRDPLIAGLSKDTAGRFTEQDAGMLGSLFPAPGDSANTLQIKRNQINKLISEKMNFPVLKQYNLDPTAAARFNANGQSKFTKLPPKIGQ